MENEPVSENGWDINVWVEEPYSTAVAIFDAISRLIEELFDDHDPDDECLISWGMSMGPAKFEKEEDDEE